ncbi:Quino protein amine dehydrogenase [Sparassis latifolia]
MDFTEIYKQTASLVAFSPGTHFLLTAVQDRLVVRRADSFQITRTWALDPAPAPSSSSSTTTTTTTTSTNTAAASGASEGWITHAGWSCDSEYVMGACARRGLVEVFRLRDEAWRARIDAGVEGLVKAEWAPDGRSVLCFSEWGLRVTIWSLVSGSATYIQYPVHPDRGYAFRADGRYFALAERHKSRDTLGVYDASASYRLVRHFALPTSSLAGLALSPTGNTIAVWEGPLEFKLCVLTLAGELLGTFAPAGGADPGFGVRAVAWHPAGLFLAVAGYDDKVHVLESLTWAPVATLELQQRVPAGVTVWREPEKWLDATHGRGFLSYERVRGPTTLPAPPTRDRRKPPLLGHARGAEAGGGMLGFNVDGSRLLVRFEGAPRAVHLFGLPAVADLGARRRERERAVRLRTVLVHGRAVAGVRWNPVRRGRLGVCTGEGSVYLWSDEWEGVPEAAAAGGAEEGQGVEEVAECVGVPAKQFATRGLRWAPDGRGLILLDRDTFCCAFEVEDAEAEAEEGVAA